jgi:hypothetical protein
MSQISLQQFPLSLLEVSRIVADVGAPGGASGNFQSRVSTIRDVGRRSPIEEEEEEEEDEGEKEGEEEI